MYQAFFYARVKNHQEEDNVRDITFDAAVVNLLKYVHTA